MLKMRMSFTERTGRRSHYEEWMCKEERKKFGQKATLSAMGNTPKK
jgi:hypothetical protein